MLKILRYSIVFGLLVSIDTFAHSEADKNRYVAQTGHDSGTCDKPLRPCASISYAVKNANKGDSVLVASGTYEVKDPSVVIYLSSRLVPVYGGYNRFDHFQTQSPENNPTYLKGIPLESRDEISKNGFKFVGDGKRFVKDEKLKLLYQTFSSLSKVQRNQQCTDGLAGSFPCSNVDLLSHIPLSQMTSRPDSANDVWGHIDLNTGKEYALVGVNNGVVVFDVSDPVNTAEVGYVSGSRSFWRDIKVYQYYDTNINLWRAYAYAGVDDSEEGITIIDLNNLPENVSVVERNNAVRRSHNLYISGVDYSLNVSAEQLTPKLYIMGADGNSSFHSYSLSDPRTLLLDQNQNFNGYTHDGTSLWIQNGATNLGCVDENAPGCNVFVDFNEKEIAIWDITDTTNTQRLSSVTYNDVTNDQKYIHSGWGSEDKRFIFVHDEFDEQRAGVNTTVRVFQVDDLRNPVNVAIWRGPTAATDHNGFVRGNRYYMSNYERGLSVLDISDPTNPVEAGYFDTFPSQNNPTYNGAWGTYPFLPSGNILVSDINSGLYVLRDNTKVNSQGGFQFENSRITVTAEQEITIPVLRVGADNNASEVQVSYELIDGSARINQDYRGSRGTLTWAQNDTAAKTISVEVLRGSNPYTKDFFIRLYNPTSGATLSGSSYLTVNIDGETPPGIVEFEQDQITVPENLEQVSLTVTRLGNVESAATAEYQITSQTALVGSDVVESVGTLSWEAGDSSDRQVAINLINDNDSEENEEFTLELLRPQGVKVGGNNTITITIRDDESNITPQVSLGDDREVNAGQRVQLSALVTDADDSEWTYQWRQTAGTPLTIFDADTARVSVITPRDQEEVLTFQLQVTDFNGAVGEDEINLTVVVPRGSSSGSLLDFKSILGLILLLIFRHRKR